MKTKTWCRHIKLTFSGHWMINGWDYVHYTWKFCPICGTKRPKKK